MNIPEWFLTELSERLGNRLLAQLDEAGRPDLVRLAACALWVTWLSAPTLAAQGDVLAWLEESLQLLDYPSEFPSRS